MLKSAHPMPIGASLIEGGTFFRIWAPDRWHVKVLLDEPVALEPEGNGYYSALVPGVMAGTRYAFQLDDEDGSWADPASRFQPEGPEGPSEVVDPAFPWTDADWPGVSRRGQVVYEMHVGTFTPEGTWTAAAEHLPRLADLGITVIEMMPVADFFGRFGWGYDGVNLFAPTRLYGRPDDLRRFIDRAHALGIGVILDVVYNHIGPRGNPWPAFTQRYFTDRYDCEWGEAINFDGPDAAPVREYFIQNAAYWIREFHFDGLRLDATQSIFCAREPHVIAEIVQAARDAAHPRRCFIVAENEPQDAALLADPAKGGQGVDAVWNDDFHHSAMVAATGRNPAYYSDHRGTPQEFVSAAKYGWLYQGQNYAHQGKRRGEPVLNQPPEAFVTYLQNHDQVANTGSGRRLDRRTSPARLRALTATMLLMPGTPMLFQGQEFAASTPFFYFADMGEELRGPIADGRAEFLKQFPALATTQMQNRLAPPDDPDTFARSRLDWAEWDQHAEAVALHRDLLALRRTDPVLAAQGAQGLDGAVLEQGAFLLRFGRGCDARLLLVNLGRDLHKASLPEPLLAPPAGCRWQLAWSSEDPAYGGSGTPQSETNGAWTVPSEAAVLMAPRVREEAQA
ncbi:malto-oligosyltrehalose trehalohydrolase [Paracoccus benzoatiresistens]|uniref:Malto-oligosyltrehalose trehalohydrolase n=1 Tax=Paracoccus benzoatiresistens TaxID=2997341 RepID=A0ABT4JBF0_9RHOB|nr:malto-oligosyltrehalose trehalohydrolase [Paracoccus sp. EF6]MCZ0964408.1 malto-oligosyltrehalose trehalohydrolase [Paracoccus sp. EF6]